VSLELTCLFSTLIWDKSPFKLGKRDTRNVDNEVSVLQMAPWRTILSDDVMFQVRKGSPTGCTDSSRLSHFVKERRISSVHRIISSCISLMVDWLLSASVFLVMALNPHYSQICCKQLPLLLVIKNVLIPFTCSCSVIR
jgi:hypothetical protein